jgi:hypothetical protein
MGSPRGRHSVRRLLSFVAIASLAASAMVVLGMGGASAASSEIIVSAGTSFSMDEGTGSGTQVVANFRDTGTEITRPSVGLAASVAEPTCEDFAKLRFTTSIDWGDETGSDTGGTVSCNGQAFRLNGSHFYRDSGIFHINVTVSDTLDDETATGTDTATATVTDAALGYDDYDKTPTGGKAAEGDSVTVGAAFFDKNANFPEIEGLSKDPGINGTIDWGDGSAVEKVTATEPPSGCECFGDIWLTGSHVYDANTGDASYTVKITANDDGGSTASHDINIKVSDGALTAGTPTKSFSATAGQATTQVVGSFTDAAGSQAKVADFTASIKWGDDATSSGTIAQTAAGAFDVSGSHTYAATGDRTLTITVTDEEGQTVSMTASATVGAAPVALPLTGQAKAVQGPASLPVLPLISLAIVLMGLTVSIRRIAVRIRH